MLVPLTILKFNFVKTYFNNQRYIFHSISFHRVRNEELSSLKEIVSSCHDNSFGICFD